MKYVKMLGLAAIAAAALMAFVGASSASATELTCTNPPGTKVMCPEGTVIKSASEGKAVLDAPFGNVECNSTVEGAANTGGGSSTETVSGNISSLTFTNCGGDTVTVLAAGSLEIHTKEATANNNGTLTSSKAKVTVIHLGVHCIYETENTDIGTVTGSGVVEGKATKATLDISATIPRVGGEGGAFCGSSAPWTGSYVVNSPEWLGID